MCGETWYLPKPLRVKSLEEHRHCGKLVGNRLVVVTAFNNDRHPTRPVRGPRKTIDEDQTSVQQSTDKISTAK
jgi:hypothetical protein